SARMQAALRDATRHATNVRAFPARATDSPLLKIAAVLAAGVTGFFLARGTSGGPNPIARSFQPTPSMRTENVSLVSNKTLDAAQTGLDLSGKPRLANVAVTPADESGRVSVSFDVTTRYTVVGKPEEPAVANVLVSLMSGGAETAGAKG